MGWQVQMWVDKCISMTGSSVLLDSRKEGSCDLFYKHKPCLYWTLKSINLLAWVYSCWQQLLLQDQQSSPRNDVFTLSMSSQGAAEPTGLVSVAYICLKTVLGNYYKLSVLPLTSFRVILNAKSLLRVLLWTLHQDLAKFSQLPFKHILNN